MNRKGVDLSGVIGSAPEKARDIETVTAEILTLKQTAGDAILAIGARLIEAKEMLPHGEWLSWLSERVEFSERAAQNFMRLAREWSNPQALADLGATKALTLLALPPEEREQFLSENHVVNGEAKAAAEMTTRELEQAVRERDEARLAAEEARASAQAAEEGRVKMEADMALLKERFRASEDAAAQARQELETIQEELKALQAKPVEVAVMEADEEKISAARAEAAEMQAKVDKAKAAQERAEAQRKAAEAALAEANAKLEAAAREEKRDLIGADRELTQFEVLFGQVQEAVNRMRGLFLKVRSREDPDAAEKLARALLALSERVKEAAV